MITSIHMIVNELLLSEMEATFMEPFGWNGASRVAQVLENLSVMQETWVWSLGWEDPLKKGKATHSSILAWRIPWTLESGGLQSMASQRVRHDQATNTFTLGWNRSIQAPFLAKAFPGTFVSMFYLFPLSSSLGRWVLIPSTWTSYRPLSVWLTFLCERAS